jgi:5-methyltetrahydrofolate--homocysteine methyltransferase
MTGSAQGAPGQRLQGAHQSWRPRARASTADRLGCGRIFPSPAFTGVRRIDRLSLRGPGALHRLDPRFFSYLGVTWGGIPAFLADPHRRTQGQGAPCGCRGLCWRKSFAGDLLTARGVYGFFPANSVGDDIELYRGPLTGARWRARSTRSGNKQKKPAGPVLIWHWADYVAPKRDAGPDGTMSAPLSWTAGIGVEALCAKFEKGP